MFGLSEKTAIRYANSARALLEQDLESAPATSPRTRAGEVHPGRPARGDDLQPCRCVSRLRFGERPVDRGDRGVLARVLAVLMVSFFVISGTGTPLSFNARAKRSMS
ncbi:hypothetical protein ADK91_25165 [Streptomyces sp. XY511]|nr:hypothetical protein ADK91_25165 [Streptomyces sp. XY511]